jgi:hypothetical protein
VERVDLAQHDLRVRSVGGGKGEEMKLKKERIEKKGGSAWKA